MSIVKLCKMFEITPQGYYKGLKRKSKQMYREEIIIQLVQSERRRHPRMGGKKLYHKLKKAIQEMGIKIGRDKFFTLLREENLLIKRRKRYARTTDSNHHFRTYTNLIKDVIESKPDGIWLSDITYMELTGKRYMYLSLVTDDYSRKIVGWYLSDSLGVEGTLKALKQAIKGRETLEGTIHHSDRGIQYCCKEYTKLLTSKGIQISMAEKGNPYENAKAERVNGILKDEYGLSKTFSNERELRKAIKEAIYLYNNDRPHMSIGYLTPEEKYNGVKAA